MASVVIDEYVLLVPLQKCQHIHFWGHDRLRPVVTHDPREPIDRPESTESCWTKIQKWHLAFICVRENRQMASWRRDPLGQFKPSDNDDRPCRHMICAV